MKHINQKKLALSKRDPNAAVIYCRVSDPKQAASGLGLEYQERECRAYCREKNWRILDVFVEKGISAIETEKRPEYQRLIKFCCENKEVSKIVVWESGRLSADLQNVFTTMYALIELGVFLVDVQDPQELSTSFGRKAQSQKFIEARFERERGSERTTAAMLQARIKGYYVGRAPLGYKNARSADDHGSLTIDPKEGPIVKKCFEMMASGGYTKEEVVCYANDLGLRTRSGNEITAKFFWRTFRNDVYSGYQYVEEIDELKKGVWEPLVDKSTFDAVQNSAKRRGSNKRKSKQNKRFPLVGLVRCAKCYTLTRSFAKKCYPYYHCQPSEKCKSIRIRASGLHALFAFFLSGLCFEEHRIELIISAIVELSEKKEEDDNQQIRVLSNQLERLHDRLTKAEMKLTYETDDVIIEATKNEYSRIKKEIEKTRCSIESIKVRKENRKRTPEIFRKVTRRLSQIWLSAEFEHRRLLQNALFPEPEGLGFRNDYGFLIPDSDLMYNRRFSLTFESVNPGYDANWFAEFLLGYHKSLDAWESDHFDRTEEKSDH